MSGISVQTVNCAANSASGGQRYWRRFCANRMAFVSLLFTLMLTILCVGYLPWGMADQDGQSGYDRQNPSATLHEPSVEYPLGSDELGRSLLARLLFGGAVSLGIGIAAAAIAVAIGVGWGATAGCLGGRVDEIMMRIVDILYGLPYILLVILFKVAFEGPLSVLVGDSAANIVIMFLAIGSVSWLTMARVIRAQVLSLMGRPFIESARASGASTPHIILRHLLPNLIGTILIYATLTIPQAILQESFLSFLGVGVSPPVPTWGALAADGVAHISTLKSSWWLMLWPCLTLSLTLLALNFIGDGLSDALDGRHENSR